MEPRPPEFYDHPVFHPDKLRLKTPMMKTLSERVHRWLWTGATGGVIIGASQVGKTRAVVTLLSNLRTRANIVIPTAYISTPWRDQSTILSVFRQLCYGLDLPVKTNARADHLSDQYVHHLADRALAANCSQLVLVVDEMQRFHPRQYNAFAEVYDKLRLMELSLTVVLVGNDQECTALFTHIETPQYSHIRGRFFTQGFTFKGLTCEQDVRYCLEQYDTLRYPTNGPTYTACFLPEPVARGWRLASLSGDLWRVFREYQRLHHIESWAMKSFTVTVNTLLSDCLPHTGVEDIDDDIIHECIDISGVIPSLVWLEA